MSLISLLPLMFAQVSPDHVAQFFDAIRKGDAAQVRSLLAADPKLAEASNQDGVTPALWAVYTRHAELAPTVLGAREPDFFEACALGRRDLAAQLLKEEPKLVDGYSRDGFTGLGLAVFFGHLEIASMLVESGADVNRPSRNSIRVSPLHSAVASGSVALLDLLLSHGAAPDPVEFLEATPLHSAAAQGSREMVEKLLAAGADRHRKTKDGKTAADLAREYKHPELAGELEK
jgi:ankyrin repeat protein